MLTGKHGTKKAEGEVANGRFKDNANYYDRYYKDDVFQGLELIASECEKAGLSSTEFVTTSPGSWGSWRSFRLPIHPPTPICQCATPARNSTT